MNGRADQWLIDHVGLEQFKGGFERVFKLIRPWAQEIQKKSKIITIAGTNGKGQTSFDLFHLLKTSGKKAAVWTSPHILSVVERFGFSDDPLDDETLLQKFEACADLLDLDLSYYEFLFAVFCRELLERECEYVILEVGMGGRLDAVNVFDADCAAIVSISYDHQAILGNSLEQILSEKWGVTRTAQKLYTTLEASDLREYVERLNQQTKAQWSDLFSLNLMHHEDSYSLRNRMLALSLWHWLLHQQLPTREELMRELQELSFSHSKGRQEQMTRQGHRFIFIGAHNVDGVAKMMSELRQKGLIFDQVWFSFSARPMDEIDQMMESFRQGQQQARVWRFFEFDHPKAFEWTKLERQERQLWEKWILELTKQNIKAEKIEQTFKDGLDAIDPPAQNILVTGSYYFIASVQKLLG